MKQTDKNNGLLTLNEVADLLKLNSIPAVKRWLDSKNISVYKFSKINYAYEIEVLCEIHKPLAINLKLKHPRKWKELFSITLCNEQLFHFIVSIIDETPTSLTIRKVKTKNKSDEKLLKELLAA